MERYNNTIQDSSGNIITTATVTVYLSISGAVASIFLDDETTPINNPFTISDSNYTTDGSFWFKAANGTYDIKVVNGVDTALIDNETLFDFDDDQFLGSVSSINGSQIKNINENGGQQKLIHFRDTANEAPTIVCRNDDPTAGSGRQLCGFYMENYNDGVTRYISSMHAYGETYSVAAFRGKAVFTNDIGKGIIIRANDATTSSRIEFQTHNGSVAATRFSFNYLGHFLPEIDVTYDIGSTSKNVKQIYTDKITAKTGILFGTDTAAANTLNDYDQGGTWTPVLMDDSLNTGGEGQTTSAADGVYTLIGDTCFYQGHLNMSALGTLVTSEAARITMPLVANATGARASVSFGQAESLNIAAGQMVSGLVIGGQSYFTAMLWDSAGGTTSLLISEVTASGDLYFSGSYKI